MTRSILILGGARSGKTRRALQLAAPFGDKVYIATAEARDHEMRARIAHHRAERGPDWRAVEASHDLVHAIVREDGAGRVLLVDCLTLWLSNLVERNASIESEIARLADRAGHTAATLILVSNELGLGLVPETPLGRAFRDDHGRLNQAMAAAVDRVELVVAGLPLTIKG